MKKRIYQLFLILLLNSSLWGQALSGTYTIGSGGNYSTLNDAVTALTTNGVSSAVTFNIINGTYTEQITIPAITGTSSTNTITFQAQTRNRADVIIQYSAADYTNNYLCRFDTTSYITFQHLTFTALGTTYGKIFIITSTTHITINDCILNGSTNADPDIMGYRNLINIYGGGNSNFTFTGNTFLEGTIALCCYPQLPFANTTLVQNNIFSNQHGYAIKFTGTDYMDIINNTINSAGGIYFSRVHYINVNNNSIISIAASGSLYGLYILGGEATYEMNNRIYNNFITSYGSAAFYIADEKYLNCYFNTIRKVGVVNASSSALKIMYTDYGGGRPSMHNVIQNNIIVNECTGYALYLEDRENISSSDYNDLYTNGSVLVNCYDGFITYANLEDWQNDQSLDFNSVSCSVNFVSTSNSHLTGASIGDIQLEGIPISGITLDYDGDTRNTSFPYKGADEGTTLFTNPLAGTFTVGAGGDYASLSAAVSALKTRKINDDVIFNILPGTYTEQVNIPESTGASETNTIAFQSQTQDASSVILEYNSTSESNNWIVNNASSYISFKYLTFTTLGTEYANAILFRSSPSHPSHVNISNSVFNGLHALNSGSDSYIIEGRDIKNAEISNNTFNYGLGAIKLDSYNSSESNTLNGNTFNQQRGQAIILTGQRNIIISCNIINNSPGGISVGNYCVGAIISNNKINCGSRGIEFSFADGTIDSPNLVYNNMVFCHYDAIYVDYSPYTYIYYNTLKIERNAFPIYSVLRLSREGNDGSRVLNNILINISSGYTYLVDTPPDNYTSDYNNYFSTGTLFSWNGSDYNNITTLNANSGTDLNSVSCEVNFTSETDLHLTGASINHAALFGIPIDGITTDIDGELRDPVHPIMGADEPYSFLLANVKVFLQGAYSGGTMTTTLNSSGLIPLNQPYNTAPWNYAGSESVESIPADVVDWVLIELRTGTESATKVAERACFLKSDGTVVDLDGTSQLQFSSLSSGDYYIVIRHRNHLAIMSAAAVTLTSSSVLYDFTTAQAQAYGTNPMVDLGESVFGMIAGDCNSDGIVKYNLGSNDRAIIYSRIGSGSINSSINGYFNEDVNMNGSVKYNLGGNDRAIIFQCIGGCSINERVQTQVPN